MADKHESVEAAADHARQVFRSEENRRRAAKLALDKFPPGYAIDTVADKLGYGTVAAMREAIYGAKPTVPPGYHSPPAYMLIDDELRDRIGEHTRAKGLTDSESWRMLLRAGLDQWEMEASDGSPA